MWEIGKWNFKRPPCNSIRELKRGGIILLSLVVFQHRQFCCAALNGWWKRCDERVRKPLFAGRGREKLIKRFETEVARVKVEKWVKRGASVRDSLKAVLSKCGRPALRISFLSSIWNFRFDGLSISSLVMLFSLYELAILKWRIVFTKYARYRKLQRRI